MKIFDENEKLEYSTKTTLKANLKNTLIANLIYIIMWLAFDIFFVYIITMNGVSQQFWFVTISVCGLNLLFVWAYVFKVLKLSAELKTCGYMLTDKAIYYYNDGKYKEVKRIAYEDVVVIEKSEYFCDGFYVASESQFIKFINIADESNVFNLIASKIKSEETEENNKTDETQNVEEIKETTKSQEVLENVTEGEEAQKAEVLQEVSEQNVQE